MFTPPPSPLPRPVDYAAAQHTDDERKPWTPVMSGPLLTPPLASPAFGASPTHSPSAAHVMPTVPRQLAPVPEKAARSAARHMTHQSISHLETADRKKSTGRRMRALALLAPALLVLLTLCWRRYAACALAPTGLFASAAPPPPGNNHHLTDDDALLDSHSSALWKATGFHGIAESHASARRRRWLAARASTSASTTTTSTDGGLLSSASSSGSSTATSSGPVALPSQTVPLVPPSTPPPAIPNPFPQPFDVAATSNFTSPSCQAFFTNFTQDINFRSCRSFGLLFESSQAFFQQETNLTVMNNIIWGTCNTPSASDDCVTVMDGLARELKDDACKSDLGQGNALAEAALNGFQSYLMYRTIGCLQNPQAQQYCYLDALQSSSPADVYFYSLGQGIPIPNATAPTCSQCTKALMGVYADYASNSSLTISKTYNTAQKRTSAVCGEAYALPVVIVGAAPVLRVAPLWAALVVAALVVMW